MENIWELFRKDDPEVEMNWIRDALAALDKPKTLTERNWVQLMLAERHRAQFRTESLLDSMKKISPLYGNHFPH